MNELITVVAIDDHILVRQGIKSQLDQTDGITLVAQGGTGDEAIALTETHQPDVLLLDIDMPQSVNGSNSERFQIIPAIHRIKQNSPSTAIVILSQYISHSLIEEVLAKGVQGYLLKEDPLTAMLAQSIQTVHYGGLFFSKGIYNRMNTNGHDLVTPRQKEILLSILRHPNWKYAEHAKFLGLAKGTLKNKQSELFKQLGVSNRTACILECIKMRIIVIEDDMLNVI